MPNTYQNLITTARQEVDDSASSRWSDATIFGFLTRATRRINHIVYKNDIQIFIQLNTITTYPGIYQYYFPSDYMVTDSIWYPDVRWELTPLANADWEKLLNPSEIYYYRVNAPLSVIELAGTPTATKTLHHYYWPQWDTASLTMDSYTVAGGRMDDLLIEYATLRMKNVDEMNFSQDIQLMQDLEALVLNTWGTDTPNIKNVQGWLAGTYSNAAGGTNGGVVG